MKSYEKQISERINRAVEQADTTRNIIIGSEALSQTPACFQKCFGDQKMLLIADPNTYMAAGKAVLKAFTVSGKKNIARSLILEDKNLYGEYTFVEKVRKYLAGTNAIPIAVGSGTINDLVKLASHQCGRPYMVVATAASMDGYTAYGASITKDGLKQTFSCPAPTAVVADIEVIKRAPEGMNASGYADLIAKIPAGADWLLADALGIEPIHSKAWSMVQLPLRSWMDSPEGIRVANHNALIKLTEGLIMSGLAMQTAKSSRPAAGAEHQFSHLWDCQHHTYNGVAPSHGFKVGIGSICSEALYENILKLKACDFIVEAEELKKIWPTWSLIEKRIYDFFKKRELAEQVVEQCRAKYLAAGDLAQRMRQLRLIWPDLKIKLQNQLIGPEVMQTMIRIAGAPPLSTEIGISPIRLAESFYYARLIRTRYTVLDLVSEMGMWDCCVEALFQEGGFWAKKYSKIPGIREANEIHLTNIYLLENTR